MTKQHINIKNDKQVAGVSTGTGLVTAPTWQPNKGRAEAEALARERQAAFEEMMEAERLAKNPELIRIQALEDDVSALKAELISMKDLIGEK